MGTRPDVAPEEEALLRAAARSDAAEPALPPSEARHRLRRRRSDFTPRPALSSTPAEQEAAGTLRQEVIFPLGLGVLVIVATLAVLGLKAERDGWPVVTVVCMSAVVLTVGLLWWTSVILKGATRPAIEELKRGLREVEEGNYDVRLERVGVAEFSELAECFNRMTTIVAHQRDRLKELANSDVLTELSNYRHFHEQVRAELQRAKESGGTVAVISLDVDRFKRVNDRFGDALGDQALRAVGAALRKVVRSEDCVARLGGDDFGIVIGSADLGLAREIAERARGAIVRNAPGDVEYTVSAGYVCWPDHTRKENLTELAQFALAHAKQQGGDCTVRYDEEQAKALPSPRDQREEIEDLLAEENPITPVFQPLVELTTGRVVGYEALARFAERSPDSWFNQAHACGLAAELEAAAIQAALKQPDRPARTYLSLNCSPSAIASGRVRKLLPDDLSDYVIEITEHELASEDGALEHGLQLLRGRGARIAVDDAGAGYAGLKQVMRVTPDIIKLDRSLVEGVHADSAKAALIEFFVLFARRVGANVCSEGIETIDELTTLIDLGVHYGQGYLLGRPGPPWAHPPANLQRQLALGALRRDVDALEAPRGPVNRRLKRYHVAGRGRAARRAR